MKLRELRKQKGITQDKLSKILELNKMTYNNYENENRQPPIETLCKIADYYHVTLDYLVGRKFVLDIGYLSDDQKEIVHLIQQLDDNSLQPVKALLKSMIDNK